MQDSKKILVAKTEKINEKHIDWLFNFIKLNWPLAFRYHDKYSIIALKRCWLHMFEKLEPNLIRDAAYECLKTCRYAPQVVDVFQAIEKIQKQKKEKEEEEFVVAENVLENNQEEEEFQKNIEDEGCPVNKKCFIRN